jgi:CDP-glycerol glycerophosphotransferase (TagB/SpsB family)
VNSVYFAHYLPAMHQVAPLMRLLGGTLWTDDRSVAQAMKRLHPDLTCRKFLFTSGRHVSHRAMFLEGDVFIGGNAHTYFFNRVPGPRVQCFHGVSSKGFAAQWRNVRSFDLCLLAGERMRRDFEAAGLLDCVRCEVVGHIRGDWLTHGNHGRERRLRDWGLDPHAPTVLYAPTWSGLSSFNAHGLEIVEAVPAECNLLVKLHSWTIRRCEAPEMVRRVKAAVKRRARASMIDEAADIHPAMAAADMMIGDRSSVCEEFLLLDRPIIFFDHLSRANSLDAQTRALVERGDWTQIHRCGPVVSDGATLRDALGEMQRHPDQHGAERRKMRDFVFHQPNGKAAERAAVAIRKLAEEMRGRVIGQRYCGDRSEESQSD